MYAEQQYNERQRLLNHTITIWNDYGSFWLQHVRKKNTVLVPPKNRQIIFLYTDSAYNMNVEERWFLNANVLTYFIMEPS